MLGDVDMCAAGRDEPSTTPVATVMLTGLAAMLIGAATVLLGAGS